MDRLCKINQKYVERPLLVELLGGKYKDGGTVVVDVDEKQNKIVFHAAAGASAKKTRQKAEA